jgi:rhamnosyltransferase subunit B
VVRAAYADDPEAVLLACNFCLGARLAAEAVGLTKMATLHVSPYSIHNIDDGVMFERMLSTVIAPPLNDLRAEAGLAPLAEGVRQWWESPRCVIGMFPEWLSPVRSGWPAQTRLVGFPFYDQHDQHATESALEEFLASGDPPIAFTPGTGMWHGESFFRESAEACRRLGRRGILLTRHLAHVPSLLPPGVIHVPYAPFGQLFPRCCAVVHHVGMGTLAQALAAGVPQVLMPMSHDQPVNAGCAATLGVGTIVPPDRYTAETVAEALSALLTTPLVAMRCRNVVEAFRYNRGAEAVCDIAEELAQDMPSSPATPTSLQAIGAAT